jgi:predicted AlkP superfamily pyrophosphatase or phosphodiesterase
MTGPLQYFALILAVCAPIARSEPPLPKIRPDVVVTSDSSSSANQKQNVDLPTASAAPLAKPVDAIDRVLIITIDGLRPDLLLRANMPHVRSLCDNGSFSFWAETTPEAYTLPCHVSMLTGAPADKHGVTWNEYIEQSYPNVPTLFEVAKRAGLTTAMATGKMKFIVFTRPGALDDYYYPAEEPVTDDEVAVQATAILRKLRPHVLFVHLPGVDTLGHDFGWGSKEQMAAIEAADRAVGRVINTLEALQLDTSTLVLVTADHGGAAKSHEMNDPRSRFIPWIASGPGVRIGFDLTLLGDRAIRIEDTYSTACAFLGVEPGRENRGKPVLEILNNDTSH